MRKAVSACHAKQPWPSAIRKWVAALVVRAVRLKIRKAGATANSHANRANIVNMAGIVVVVVVAATATVVREEIAAHAEIGAPVGATAVANVAVAAAVAVAVAIAIAAVIVVVTVEIAARVTEEQNVLRIVAANAPRIAVASVAESACQTAASEATVAVTAVQTVGGNAVIAENAGPNAVPNTVAANPASVAVNANAPVMTVAAPRVASAGLSAARSTVPANPASGASALIAKPAKSHARTEEPSILV
jgi:hypothetical protein